MPTFFSREGDDGTTGLLGEGRVPKYDLRIEVLGAIDEATAALGLARVYCQVPDSNDVLIKIQRDLYLMMGEVAATPKNAERFNAIHENHVNELEERTELLEKQIEMPREFILPGDSLAGAALDLARTIVRRAERRLAELLHQGDVNNPELLRYLNRLSSLLFVLELRENQAAGKHKPTLAKSG
jgi:cob(I)alamin adenosyltransferase